MALTPNALTADTATVAVHFVRLVTDYASQRQLPIEHLLAEAGLAADCLRDNDARISFAEFTRLCDTAARQLDEPLFGLRAGQHIKPGHFGSHGFALISCATVSELLQHSLRYSGLVLDACRNEVVREGEHYVRYWRSNLADEAPVGRLQDELNMAAWVTLARWTAGRPELAPDWVSFRHEPPDDLSEYEALFRCPLRFGAPATAVAFPARYLDMALPQANPDVRRMMHALCERQLARLLDAREPDWLGECRQAIVQGFSRGVPELEPVAARVGMSARELQRRLGERGLNFRDLVDGLRARLALEYMRDPALGLVDIAYLLGFSEQSAFQRAFKRWTGQTPMGFRRGV